MIVENFQHKHAGHCETGVTSSLLGHYGLPLSEPMALGLSGSLTFVHIPMVKIGGFPLTAYRMMPGSVYKGLKAALGLKLSRTQYRDPDEAMADLDRQLAAGRPVGLQTSVYWLPYFPPEMRFHFNAHNMIVYGKDGDDYLVSDPVFDQPQRCPAADLRKARFTQGAFAPKGLMYYPTAFTRDFDLDKAVRAGIKRTWKMMLYTPVPLVGVRAIRGLAKTIEKLPQKKPDARYQRLFVGNIVRMQEEIGTGGGGFRFMYAAFLQEAGEKLKAPLLLEAAKQMTETGDAWREFALAGAQFSRQKNNVDCAQLGSKLRICADREEAVYRLLKTL
ncbi:MAG TPA: BtrH N-terminal domain-containing protein [Solimonas sp.]|nr:BtrH N-terminal domain-containing protein [Solimonas sp.]